MPKKVTEETNKDRARHDPRRMVGTVRKVVLASVGVMGVAQDELQALIERMVERGELTEQDARKLVNDVQKEVNKRRKGGSTKAEREMEGLLEKLNIPSKADIEDLTKQVTMLSKRIEELKAGMNGKQ